MTGSYSQYERELKEILMSQSFPFYVVRAAGSHGMDLVALRNGQCWPIEVKASRSLGIIFTSASGRAQAQFRELVRETKRAKVPLLYAFRRIGGPKHESKWRMYSARRIKGIPPIHMTPAGNRVMHWAEGIDLDRWLRTLED